MKRIALGLVFLCVGAAQMKTRTSDGLNRIQASSMKADLTFLASDALEGRMSLQRGSDVAIEWIASEFARAGLRPLAGGTFLQKVPLIEYRVDRQESRLEVNVGGRSQTFRFPEASGAFPEDVDVTAPVMFAGFGITAPELHYDDYAGVDARGKIVLIFDHEPQENDSKSIFNGRGNTRYAGTFVKVSNAQAHGAKGVLIVAEPNRRHPSNQERMARIAGSQQRMSRMPSQALADGALRIPMFSIGDAVAAELLAASGKKAAELHTSIDRDLKPVSMALPGTEASLHVVLSERRRGTSDNVIGMVEGSDPALKDETVIFSAHYDHDGIAANGIMHGADDNGSGTVGVVALARAFAANPIKPRRTVVFAIFAAEERGLLGSYYYVAHPLRPIETTRAVINFDMIGRNETESEQTKGLIAIAPDTSNDLNLVGTNYSPDYRAVVEKANDSVGLRLDYKWDEEPALNVFFRSDQYPFVLKDVPAIWWFTGFHPDYHQTTDMVDRINFPKMEKIVKLAYLAGFDFADAATPPRFVH
jgi:hypothetical protein